MIFVSKVIEYNSLSLNLNYMFDVCALVIRYANVTFAKIECLFLSKIRVIYRYLLASDLQKKAFVEPFFVTWQWQGVSVLHIKRRQKNSCHNTVLEGDIIISANVIV